VQIDRIRIQPRLRNAWQAIDLGWVMARRWWWPLFLSWIIPYQLVLALALLAAPRDYWLLASFVPWLCKPLWDAAPLYILSRRMFGQRVGVTAAWRAVLRQMRWEIVPWLTWRRLSPTRSMDMPVTVLEQLRGNPRSRRLGVLHLQNTGGAIWLTVVCAYLEIIIAFGLISLLFWFVPDEQMPAPGEFFDSGHAGLEALQYFSFALCTALVAPFYVAAGFSLYINRRIDLEGWDIEIRFRHMANAAQRARSALAVVAMATALVALSLCPAFAPRSYADAVAAGDTRPEEAAASAAAKKSDPQQFAQSQQAARQRIDKILAGADFKNAQTERHWRLKQDKNAAKKDSVSKIPEWLIKVIEALENVFGFTRDHQHGLITAINLLRLLFWVALIGLFGWLLYRYRDSLREWLHLPAPERRRSSAAPEVMFGLDVRVENLPDDVIAEVNRLWQRQLTREALSLLYRATLAKLLQRFALPFRDDMTEGECEQIATASTPAAVAAYFSRLTRTWQRQAYAHVAPNAEAMQEFCGQWQQVFGDAR
jgi:hypothetical protein